MSRPGAGRELATEPAVPAGPEAARVLLVEDDHDLRSAMARYLAEELFSVSETSDGIEALSLILDPACQAGMGPVDVVVLDLLLPRLNGREVCYRLRRAGCWVPVLMATASGEVEHRIQGFHDGADDYIVKPFSLVELVLRLRSLLRRSTGTAESLLSVGDLHLDPTRGRVWRGRAEVTLSRREVEILALLMRRPGIVLSRSGLHRSVWGSDATVSPNTLDQYITRLRRKVDRPFGRSDIETVQGFGYRLRSPG